MENKNEFEQYTAAMNDAAAHQQEIQQTRIGGLGGSDADMLLRVGRNGLAALTATDMKRLSVMMGMAQPEQWGGNAYTKAGHAFEDYADTVLPFGLAVKEREAYIEKPLAKNFKTFAHADFASRKKATAKRFDVVECKFVQKDTEKVAQEYAAQLQWYFILGAEHVTLYHGRGQVEPFDVETVEACVYQIERNADTCKAILAGVKALDDAITDGWRPVQPDKMDVIDTSASVQRAFEALKRAKAEKERAQAEEDEAKAIIASFMEDFACTTIYDAEGATVTAIKGATKRIFDNKKLLKEHPEFDVDAYYKTSVSKASIKFSAASEKKEEKAE